MVAAVPHVSAAAAVVPAADGPLLQPGAVIDAKVVEILQADLVRIVLEGVVIDALSEVPLEAGQSLRLNVSATPQGVRLSIQPASSETPSIAAATSPPLRSAAAPRAAPAISEPLIRPENEARVIAGATQTAAARQSGLTQLFANLAVAKDSDVLPQSVRQAVTQLIALQPVLDESLDAPRLQQAVSASGLFREAVRVQSPATSPVPDLKSALIVLRQTLSAVLGDVADSAPPTVARVQNALPSISQASLARNSTPAAIIDEAPAQTIVEDVSVSKPTREETRVVLAPPAATSQSDNRFSSASSNAPRTDLLSELVRNMLAQNGASEADGEPVIHQTQSLPRTGELRDDGASVRTNVPPPPFRGAAPAPQPMLPPTLAPDAPIAVATRQLIEETDGAIARQTLLQIASLPDRTDPPGIRSDAPSSRWAFEIPFTTPQGTAVAQFEIAKDGGGPGGPASFKKIWRARFSLDVEPAGPVHAIVSLAGETTSVRMWAERPLTAARLRAGQTELAQALQTAALHPGDIVIGDGRPPQATAAPAGHFIDRAS